MQTCWIDWGFYLSLLHLILIILQTMLRSQGHLLSLLLSSPSYLGSKLVLTNSSSDCRIRYSLSLNFLLFLSFLCGSRVQFVVSPSRVRWIVYMFLYISKWVFGLCWMGSEINWPFCSSVCSLEINTCWIWWIVAILSISTNGIFIFFGFLLNGEWN